MGFVGSTDFRWGNLRSAIFLRLSGRFPQLVQPFAAFATFRPGWHLRGDVPGNFADFDKSFDGFLHFDHSIWAGFLHSTVQGWFLLNPFKLV